MSNIIQIHQQPNALTVRYESSKVTFCHNIEKTSSGSVLNRQDRQEIEKSISEIATKYLQAKPVLVFSGDDVKDVCRSYEKLRDSDCFKAIFFFICFITVVLIPVYFLYASGCFRFERDFNGNIATSEPKVVDVSKANIASLISYAQRAKKSKQRELAEISGSVSNCWSKIRLNREITEIQTAIDVKYTQLRAIQNISKVAHKSYVISSTEKVGDMSYREVKQIYLDRNTSNKRANRT